jgi:hypothetical protein
MSARRFLYGVLFAGALPLVCACGVNIIKATATTPNPTLYAKLQDGSVRIDVFDVSPGRLCSPIHGRRDFCVDNLYGSMGEGLKNTLGRYMKPGTAQATDFIAAFRLLEFKQEPSPTNAKAVQVAMRWKFTLTRVADDQAVVDIDETTMGPQEVVRADLADSIVNQMISNIFQRVGTELGQHDLSGQPPPPPPPPEPPAPEETAPQQICVPNETRECVGPAACKGGQSCLEDGSGYTECDCGKKKKK